MLIMIFSLLLAFSYAAIEDFSVGGFYSYTDLTEEVSQTSNFFHIYAGFVNHGDTEINCTTYPCDTCSGTFLAANNPPSDSNSGQGVHVCNKRALRVQSGEDLNISFKSNSTGGDNNGDGRHILTPDNDGESQICRSSTITAGSTGTITNCEWDDICNKMEDGKTDCKFTDNKPKSKIFRVGKDLNSDEKLGSNDDYVRVKIHVVHSDYFKNNNINDDTCSGNTSGVCSYNMFPGDKKAFFEETKASSNLPTLEADIKVKSVRVYYEEAPTKNDCPLVAGNFGFDSNQFEDLNVSDTSDFSLVGDPAVTGLENDKWYCFRTAIVDETGFVSGVTDASATTYTDSAIFTSEVNGLLEEGNCFIATAAFGSAVDKRLDILRNFRDQILNSFSLGRSFVSAYYQHSKPLAIWIAQNLLARHIVQILLWPLLALAYLFLNPFYLFATIILVSALIFYKRKRLVK